MSLLVFKIVTNVTRSAQIGGKWLWFDLYQDVSVCGAWLQAFLLFCMLLNPPVAARLSTSPITTYCTFFFFFLMKEIFFFFFFLFAEFVFTLLFSGRFQFRLKIEKRVYFFSFGSQHNLQLQPMARGRCFVHFFLKNLSVESVAAETVSCFWLACVIPYMKRSISSAFWLVDGVRRRNPINIILEYQ